MTGEIDVSKTDSMKDIIRQVFDSVTGTDYEDDRAQVKQKLEVLKRNEAFFYEWWAFPDEETFKQVRDNSLYPRNVGKGARPKYEEPPTKDVGTVRTNDKYGGETHGHFLGVRGVTPLDQKFHNTVRHAVDLAAYPIVALGAAKVTQEQLTLHHKGKVDLRTCDVEFLRWKWTQAVPARGSAPPPATRLPDTPEVRKDKDETTKDIDRILADIEKVGDGKLVWNTEEFSLHDLEKLRSDLDDLIKHVGGEGKWARSGLLEPIEGMRHALRCLIERKHGNMKPDEFEAEMKSFGITTYEELKAALHSLEQFLQGKTSGIHELNEHLKGLHAKHVHRK